MEETPSRKAYLNKHSESDARKAYRLLTGNEYREPIDKNDYWPVVAFIAITIGAVLLVLAFQGCAAADQSTAATTEQYCKAIYIAEGGPKTKHPYGILAKYKHTTPKQACINTVKHQYRNWTNKGSQGAFTAFLGHAYCPVGSNTDNGTCKYWVGNVNRLLNKGA